MNIVIIGIVSLIVLGLIAGIFTRIANKYGSEHKVIRNIPKDCSTCMATDGSCEQVCVMKAAINEAEYYDDEELDRFIGRSSDSYTSDEADEFAYVLYTMKPYEVKGWSRSLMIRGINVPDQIKDELIALIDE